MSGDDDRIQTEFGGGNGVGDGGGRSNGGDDGGGNGVGDGGGRSNGGDDGEGPTVDAPVVVLVDAETPGNVGTVARSMKNFGFSELLLVDPPEIEPGDEAHAFAGHAREDVLASTREVSFDEVVAEYHTVGTTAITNEDARRHVRFPFETPAGLADDLRETAGRVALVFGRESTGLSNDELERLDRVVSIPANPEYPVLNLGQAATVTLYELRELALDDDHLPAVERHRADPAHVERANEEWDRFLTGVGYDDHDRTAMERLFRRLLGRAEPTDREATRLIGLLRRASDQLDHRRALLGAYDRDDDLSVPDGDGE